jgi:hypothetical protein
MWTREEAFQVCVLIESVAPRFGGHVALTGGLLYKPGERKDCDVLVYRIREREVPVDFAGLIAALIPLGFTFGEDYGWCKKMQWNGKPVDMFDPDDDGEYPPEEEADPDRALDEKKEAEHLETVFA